MGVTDVDEKFEGVCKSFKITDFNVSDQRKQFYRDLMGVQKLCIGNEICPDSGKPHLQIYICFKQGYRWASFRTLLGGKTRFAKAIKLDWNYELKEMNYELIDNTSQGKRNDLLAVVDLIKKKKSLRHIGEEFPIEFIKFNRGIEKLINLTLPLRDWEMEVHIRWGKTGTGKTRYVWDKHGVENVYPKMTGKWWDHYTGQEVVLIDDFDPSTMFESAFDWYLKLLDRYPMYVEFKGGSISMCSKIIYITSNFNPKSWFEDRPNRKAFFRRVVTVTEVVGGNTNSHP